MSSASAVSPNSSLNALRGAVGGVLGAGDGLGCWDQVVWLWRIFWALDGLMATLWAIVYRLRAGEMALGGVGPVGAMALGEASAVVGSGLARRRAGVRAMPDRRVLTGAVAPAGGMRRGLRPEAGWGWRGRVLVGVSPISAVGWRRFSELALGASRSCVLFVSI